MQRSKLRAAPVAPSLVAFLVGLALAGSACRDPTRDDLIDALGPEKPGVPKGPLHRPGQSCILCHDGQDEARAFSIAGTVYGQQNVLDPAANVTVKILDSLGRSHPIATNCAGNFYVRDLDFRPVYPMYVSVYLGDTSFAMESAVFRDGSCAGCHADPAGATTAGHIYLHEVLDPQPLPAERLPMMAAKPTFAAAALCTVLFGAACSAPDSGARTALHGPPAPDVDPANDKPHFPVGTLLSNRCGSLDCHGQQGRNLRIYGKNGLRLDKTAPSLSVNPTIEEFFATYRSIVALEPETMAAVVESGGRQPERLTMIRKARGLEDHKGHQNWRAGDPGDRCLTSWLAGTVDDATCALDLLPSNPMEQ